jgi:hypothetical protein
VNKTTDTGVFIVMTMIILIVSIFGGHFAFAVSGVPQGSDATVSSNAPGILGILGWIWDSVKFFFLLLGFSVAGVPAIFSVVWLFFVLVYIWIIVRLIRGASISP